MWNKYILCIGILIFLLCGAISADTETGIIDENASDKYYTSDDGYKYRIKSDGTVSLHGYFPPGEDSVIISKDDNKFSEFLSLRVSMDIL